jgi:hypothetical protein
MARRGGRSDKNFHDIGPLIADKAASVGLPTDATPSGAISARPRSRANSQQGEGARLRENFRDWILRYVCNTAADPSPADDARNTASCLKHGPLISVGSGTIWAWATRSRGASSRRPLALDQRQTLRRSERRACLGGRFDRNHGDFSRHRMRLVFLFGQERRWRVERGAQGAKSLTPGFNSNRLLGKASDGNGQSMVQG